MVNDGNFCVIFRLTTTTCFCNEQKLPESYCLNKVKLYSPAPICFSHPSPESDRINCRLLLWGRKHRVIRLEQLKPSIECNAQGIKHPPFTPAILVVEQLAYHFPQNCSHTHTASACKNHPKSSLKRCPLLVTPIFLGSDHFC